MKPIWSWTTGMRFCFDRAFNSLPPSPHRVHRGRFAGGYFGWVVAIDSRVDVEHRLRSFLGSAYFVYSFSFAITSRRQPSRRATIALRFHSEERHDKSIINQIYLLSTWFTCPGALYCMQLDGMNFNCKPHHPIAIYLVPTTTRMLSTSDGEFNLAFHLKCYLRRSSYWFLNVVA